MHYSILICTHNRCRTLQKALDALGRLSVADGLKWEIVVVDNASQDQTRDVVEAFARRAHVPVQYCLEERLGHSIALNTGISASHGDIVAFTDDDALPREDWLLQLHEAFVEQATGIVFGKVEPIWEVGQPTWYSPRISGHFALLDYGPDSFVVTQPNQTFYGVNHATRREVLELLGGFREALGLHGESGGMGNDTDLCQRALEAGVRIVYNPLAVVDHMIPASRCTKSDHRRRALGNCESYYSHLLASRGDEAWLLGLPRWHFGQATEAAFGYLRSVFHGDRGEAFFNELRLFRFAGLLHQAARRGFRPSRVDTNETVSVLPGSG